MHLCNVKEQEGHHEGEETSGLSEGETENGILEELTTEGWVAGDTLDETSENRTDTDTSAGETDRGDAGTLDLCGGDESGGGRLNDDSTGLDHVAAEVAGDGGAGGAVEDQAALLCLEAGRAWWGWRATVRRRLRRPLRWRLGC
jgi:hypothetical protein